MSDVRAQITHSLASRWHLSEADVRGVGDDPAWWSRALALSMQLAALLGDNEDAERSWLYAPRQALGGLSAMQKILGDPSGIVAALDLLRSEAP